MRDDGITWWGNLNQEGLLEGPGGGGGARLLGPACLLQRRHHTRRCSPWQQRAAPGDWGFPLRFSEAPRSSLLLP